MSADSYMKLITVIAIAMTASATTYGDNFNISPEIGVAQPSRTEFHVKAVADLSCNVTVYEDEAGTRPISNGGSYGNGSWLPPQWVRFRINNAGPQKAENIQFNISIIDVTTNNPSQYIFTLVKGESKNIKLTVRPTSHENDVIITGAVAVDGNTTIDRKIFNNTCKISYHVSNVS